MEFSSLWKKKKTISSWAVIVQKRQSFFPRRVHKWRSLRIVTEFSVSNCGLCPSQASGDRLPPAPSTRQRAEGAEPSPGRRTSDVKGQLGGKTQEVHVLAPCLLSAGAECQRLEGQNKKKHDKWTDEFKTILIKYKYFVWTFKNEKKRKYLNCCLNCSITQYLY